jgi:hypothetical protein
MMSAGVAPAALDELLTLLVPWLRAPSLTQRTAAITILASGLKYYAAHLQFGYEVNVFSLSLSLSLSLSPRPFYFS